MRQLLFLFLSWERRSLSIATSLTRSHQPQLFMLGFLKEVLYHVHYHYLTPLKIRIATVFHSITTDRLRVVWKNAQNRLDAIMRANGDNIESLYGYTSTLIDAHYIKTGLSNMF